MGTPLIIDDIVIAGLRKFAEANPIRLAENERIRAGVAPPPGDRDGYHCQLPTCYKLVYSISEYAHVVQKQETDLGTAYEYVSDQARQNTE